MKLKIDSEIIDKLKEFYPEKGKFWCVKNLGIKETTVRYLTSKFKIRQNRSSDFFKEWQKRAALGKVGLKASPEVRKKLSRIQRKLNKKTIFIKNCIICHKEFTVKGTKKGKSVTKYKNLTCGKKNCLKILRQKIRKKWFSENKHPKGFLGHNHSEKSKNVISQKSKNAWKNNKSGFHTKEFKDNKSTNMSIRMVNKLKNWDNIYSRTKKGWETIGNKKYFFKSSWEVVYAKYLEWLKNKKEIIDWHYEVKTFWFEQIKRGVRSYTPDFEVINKNGKIEFHEVKGWMDSKSKTKLRRMKKYYPDIKMILIDAEIYREIKKFEKLFEIVPKNINKIKGI